MIGWTIFAIIVTFVVGIVCWSIVLTTHSVIEARNERERLEAAERALRQEAQELAWYQYIEDSKALWAERVRLGTILDFESDDRWNLVGKAIKNVENIAHRHTLRKDVHLWCRQNCAGEFAMVPFFSDQVRHARIWFSDPNDAFAFKIRWY